MSADQWLLRIARRLDYYRGADPEIVPFPDVAEIERRLLGVKAVKRSFRRELYLKTPDGRIPLSVEPDRIVAEGAAPTDLAPLLKALADLEPLAIYDPQTEAWQDSSELLSSEPQPYPAAKPIFGPPIQVPPGDGFLRMEWAAPLVGGGFPDFRDCRDGLFFLDSQNSRLQTFLTALDARTGETRWTMFIGRGIPQFALLGEVVVGISLPHVCGFDPRTGAVRWHVRVTGGSSTSPPGAHIDAERGTITVRSGWTSKHFDQSVIDARGNLLSRVRRPRSELPPPPDFVRRPEPMLAPGRPLERCLIVDERRAIHFMGAYDMVPRPEHLVDREVAKAYDEAIFGRWDHMKFVLFDRFTGEVLAEQVAFAPSDFFRATPYGPTFQVDGERICMLHGIGAYGARLRLPA